MQLSICGDGTTVPFVGATTPVVGSSVNYRRDSLCVSSLTLPHTAFAVVVGSSGLEPPTSRLSGVCSNLLSYDPKMVEVIGFEPMTPCLQGRCSTS